MSLASYQAAPPRDPKGDVMMAKRLQSASAFLQPTATCLESEHRRINAVPCRGAPQVALDMRKMGDLSGPTSRSWLLSCSLRPIMCAFDHQIATAE
jgi:hypothetical protein